MANDRTIVWLVKNKDFSLSRRFVLRLVATVRWLTIPTSSDQDCNNLYFKRGLTEPLTILNERHSCTLLYLREFEPGLGYYNRIRMNWSPKVPPYTFAILVVLSWVSSCKPVTLNRHTTKLATLRHPIIRTFIFLRLSNLFLHLFTHTFLSRFFITYEFYGIENSLPNCDTSLKRLRTTAVSTQCLTLKRRDK